MDISCRRRLPAGGLFSQQHYHQVLRRLRDRDLDSDPHLATNLGASIEALPQAMTCQGRRTEAVALLRRDVARFGGASIRFRIRKNLNLLFFWAHYCKDSRAHLDEQGLVPARRTEKMRRIEEVFARYTGNLLTCQFP